jgi:hypothetical protein
MEDISTQPLTKTLLKRLTRFYQSLSYVVTFLNKPFLGGVLQGAPVRRPELASLAGSCNSDPSELINKKAVNRET